MKYIIFLLFVGFISGCTTLDYADTKMVSFEQDRAFLITTTGGPVQGKPIGLLEVRHTGVVIFGLVPISAGYLSDVRDAFVEQGRRAGANAAINVTFETYRPPFPLCTFWWISYSKMRGELVYIKDLQSHLAPGKVEVHESK